VTYLLRDVQDLELSYSLSTQSNIVLIQIGRN